MQEHLGRLKFELSGGSSYRSILYFQSFSIFTSFSTIKKMLSTTIYTIQPWELTLAFSFDVATTDILEFYDSKKKCRFVMLQAQLMFSDILVGIWVHQAVICQHYYVPNWNIWILSTYYVLTAAKSENIFPSLFLLNSQGCNVKNTLYNQPINNEKLIKHARTVTL